MHSRSLDLSRSKGREKAEAGNPATSDASSCVASDGLLGDSWRMFAAMNSFAWRYYSICVYICI